MTESCGQRRFGGAAPLRVAGGGSRTATGRNGDFFIRFERRACGLEGVEERRSSLVRICGLVAALALVALVLGSSGAAAIDVAALVRKVQARYDDTHDFTADVTQEMTIASLGKTVTAHGTIAFKKPGKLRLELKDDDPQTVVADGTTLWFYQPKEQQVMKAPFDAAFRSTTPISFLTGVGRINDDFDVQLDSSTPTGGTPTVSPGEIVLILTPRHAASDVGQLRLTVALDTFDIRGAEVHDPLGNISRLRFDHLRRNGGVADDQFVFHVPPGVDVISAPIGQ
jgi:outer membrane lipoprotein carrier protein